MATPKLLPSGRPAQNVKSGQSKTRVACTIIAKNYLSRARVLVRSMMRTDPDTKWFVLIVEPIDGFIEPDNEPFEILQLSDLSIPGLTHLCMRYTLTELATSVKPRLLEVLFERTDCRSLFYIDPDILVLGSLAPLVDRLAERSILLTPHISQPVDDGALPGELTHLRYGLYNLGFLGLSNTPTTRRMLTWWKERLYKACVFKPEQGIFVDQKWMDLAPIFFPDTEIVRDPGCNVAFWNLHERHVTLKPRPRVNGVPLRFFHFSGYDPDRPDALSKYQDRFTMEEIGPTRELFAKYRRLLIKEDYENSSRWPYFYDSFDNGVPVTLFIRDLFDSLGEEQRRFADPFKTAGHASFFTWTNAPIDGERSQPPYVSNGLYFLWASNAKLRRHFADIRGADREPFLNWAAAHVDPHTHPIGIWRKKSLP